MEKMLIVLAAVALIMISGCTQFVENAGHELDTCMKKCVDACRAVNGDNSSEGYNSVSISKAQGAVKVSCSCTC